MANWWTEENLLKTVEPRIPSGENIQHIFVCVMFFTGFNIFWVLFGWLVLLFKTPDKFLFVMTDKAVYFIGFKGLNMVKELLDTRRFAFAELSCKTRQGWPNKVARFRASDGWQAKVEFPILNKYKPNSQLTSLKMILKKLTERCAPLK